MTETRCVNDTNGDGDCAQCARNPDAPCRQPMVDQDEVDRVTRRLWHTSQHQGCLIWLSGRIQDDVNALRAAVGLAEFGWNDSVPDEEAGRCAVHHDDHCAGQHTHNPPIRGI